MNNNTKHINITYCAQALQFEEAAYEKFQTYEQGLKDYFLQQEDGREIFDDLQLRICEILQMRMKANNDVIETSDIEFLMANIGMAETLEEEELEIPTVDDSEKQESKKKLFRESVDKMVGGVAAGLGNFFSIDPLAFRLLFVITTIMTKGFGLLVYFVLWIALKPKDLEYNYTKRLFRSNNDKVIAGVCGGIATFFKTESWIVRVVFLSPIIINFITDNIFNLNISLFNGSAIGLSVITYVVLWITTKETETPSENLLAKGEDINVNSIAEQSRSAKNNPETNSSVNTILRIIAFFVIGLAIIAIITMLAGLSFSSLFMYPLTSAVLDSQLLKWLGGLSIVFFVLWPLIGFVIWGIRRMASYKGPNKPLRLTFGSLWALGFASAITLALLLAGELNKKSFVEQRINLPVEGDTLIVKKLDDQFLTMKRSGSEPFFQNFYAEDNDVRKSKLISIKKQPSPNDSFYAKVRICAVGNGTKGAIKNAEQASYKTEFNNNTFFVSKYVGVPKDQPYRFQHAEVTIFVPKGKVAKINGRYNNIKINGRSIEIKTDEFEEKIEKNMDKLERNLEKLDDNIEDALDDADARKREANERVRKAEKESRQRIKIEKQRLKLEKERLKLEELERTLE